MDGCKVYGYLTTPDVGTTATTQPFQTLHVPKPCRILKAGDIIKGQDDALLLLMDAPQTQLSAKTFRAYGITTQYPWLRTVKEQDTVAGVMRDKGNKDMGQVYAYFERPTNSMVEHLVTTKYQFYTGQEVQVGDKVGGKVVKTVMPVLGVSLVVAE